MDDQKPRSVIKMKWAVIAVVAALLLASSSIGAGVYFKLKSDHSADINREEREENREERLKETEARQRQFCTIFYSLRRERVKRLRNTVIYLHTEAGREPTSLNLYIRSVSLPQTRQEVKKEGEHLPTSCYKNKERKQSDDSN